MPVDRRNQTSLGRKRRREFDRSVQKLHALGMPDWAVEYFRRAARVAGLPPHMIVAHVAVVAAGRQLQASIAQEQVKVPATSKGPAHTPHAGAPSYTSVQAMRRRVTTLWREIERHGSLIEPAASEGIAVAGPRLVGLTASKLPGKLAFLRAGAADPAQPATGTRRRKASPKGH